VRWDRRSPEREAKPVASKRRQTAWSKARVAAGRTEINNRETRREH